MTRWHVHRAEVQNHPWTIDELDAIVADYFAMLDLETRGRSFNKAARNRNLRDTGLDRTKGSVEMKHQNISAVLMDLGMPWIDGYKPAVNYQDAIIEAIGRHLGRPDAMAVVDAVPIMAGTLPIVSAPPRRNAPLPRGVERMARLFDVTERDRLNRDLGDAGERMVVEAERARLVACGREDLSRRVRWSSKEDGDGLGYDVMSFGPDGEKRFLEVKTTRGGIATPFYVSRNEMAFSEEEPDRFRICRVHLFGGRHQAMYEAKPPLLESFNGTVETWRLVP
jgi:hypothetical protein